MITFGWELWLIIGIVCILLDIFIGLEFFLLSFGLGCVVSSLLIYIDIFPFMQAGEWKGQLVVASIVGLVLAYPIRIYARNSMKDIKDINDY